MSYPTEKAIGEQVTATDFNDFTLNPTYTYGETLVAGNVVYLKAADSKVYKADADVSASLGALVGVVITGDAANAAYRLLGPGKIITGASGLTAGSPVYLSTTAGAATATPSAVRIGTALSTTSYLFYPETNRTPSGVISLYAGRSAPTGWLLCDGSAVSRTTYSELFTQLFPTIGTFTVTIASPAVVTRTAHGLQTGDAVYLTTTGALPTGLSANTKYWVTRVDANSFKLATTLANALASTNINTSGSQSGTHTATGCPYGVGDGSTTFNLPNLKGSVAVGVDTTQTEFAGLGQTGGEKTHVLTLAEMAAHTHTIPVTGSGTSGSILKGTALADGSTQVTSSAGSDTAHNNLQPYLAIQYIIKF
jgi:microcystin-dependent protein